MWNIGAEIKVTSLDRSGIIDTMASSGSMFDGGSRRVPFGAPVVPDVRMIWRELRRGGGSGPADPADATSRSAGNGAASAGPTGEERNRGQAAGSREAMLGEFGIEHDRRGALPLEDLGHLRPGEAGVGIQDVGAELGQGDGRLDETPVVAGQHRHPVGLADPEAGQTARHRRGLGLHLGEGHRAQMVDQGHPVRLAGGLDGVRPGQRHPVAAEGDAHADQPIGAHGAQQPRPGRGHAPPTPSWPDGESRAGVHRVRAAATG